MLFVLYLRCSACPGVFYQPLKSCFSLSRHLVYACLMHGKKFKVSVILFLDYDGMPTYCFFYRTVPTLYVHFQLENALVSCATWESAQGSDIE